MDEWIENQLKKAILAKLQAGHTGKSRPVTGEQLTAYVNRTGFPEIDQRTLRLVIRDLRREGQPICSAAGLGYFWPACLEDVEDCRGVEFDAKAKDMLATGKAMFDGAVRLFGGQRSLTL